MQTNDVLHMEELELDGRFNEPIFLGTQGPQGIPGPKGDPFTYEDFTAAQLEKLRGENGVSPTVEVNKTGKVTTITITDVNGTKTATINDGKDGQDSGGNAGFVVQDTEPEDTSVLWVDPTDNSDDGFQEAVNAALAQAKESGEFDGADGQPGKDGEPGQPGKDGEPGKDYVLTNEDKTEIAELAADLVKVPSDEHINDLINTALGVIENGTY